MARKKKRAGKKQVSPPRAAKKSPSRAPRPSWEGKRVKDLSGPEVYARRKALGLKAGKTEQEARGHRKGEHKERAARERELGITTYQRSQVRKFIQGQLKRNPRIDPQLFEAKLIAGIRLNGYDRFQQMRKDLRRMRETRRRETLKVLRGGQVYIERRNVRASENIELMEQWAEEFDLPSWDYELY
jgi:hypothetical protein